MLVRRVARPMFAAWFVVEGLDAARRPAPHVERARATWDLAARHVPLPEAPDAARLTTLVRLHGAAMLVAAAMLALGRAPRTAALVLAGLTLPLAVAHQPFVDGGAAELGGPGAHPVRDGRAAVDRLLGAERFWRALSMLGGAVLVGVDHEGRPGMAWRVERARLDRATAREARSAVAAAAREARG